MEKPHIRNDTAARKVGVVGMATALTAGALLAAAPQAAAHSSAAVSLATTPSYQPALDDLLAAMQRAVDYDMSQSYAPPGIEDEVLSIIQNTNYQLLSAGLSRVTELFNGVFFQAPEVIAGDAADPRQFFDYFTPDIYYRVTAGLADGATYKLTGTIGAGTEHFTISALAITAGSAETQASLELNHDLVVNPDGTFTVFIGPDEPIGAVNYMDDTDATADGAASLLIRDMLGDWALGGGHVSLQCVSDCPPFFAIPDGGFFPGDGGIAAAVGPIAESSDTQIDSVDSVLNLLFSAFAQIVEPFNERSIQGGYDVGMNVDPNTMFALSPETQFGAGLESALVAGGNFDLADGEALIIKMPDVEAAYTGIELMNVFGAALPYTMAQTTLNNTTAFHADDGYTYYVVSATNPGVANWLDSSGGGSTGEIFARFENVDDPDASEGLQVQTQVVPVADVADYLPADTPDVSPEEYAADMAQRVFSYDYALDLSRIHAQPDYLIQALLQFGLQGIMGEENYAAVFGEQPFTPLALRFTDALSPDWDTVSNDLMDHPTESLTAIFNNLPLLWSDISQPIHLAMGKVLLSLLLPDGPQLDTLFNDALLDPNDGIISGFLNARDDLATAILTANGGFPTELGGDAADQWANMPELIDSTPPMTLADLGDVFFGA